jgi:AsmA protein
MGRITKIILGLVAALAALFAIAAIAVIVFFDPNDFRENIAEAVKESTGRELTIDGEVSLQLFPWIAVEIGHTALGQATGFGDEPFAEFDRAELSVRLMPLLLRLRKEGQVPVQSIFPASIFAMQAYGMLINRRGTVTS